MDTTNNFEIEVRDNRGIFRQMPEPVMFYGRVLEAGHLVFTTHLCKFAYDAYKIASEWVDTTKVE